jgi:hypothetical protein
MHMNTPRIGEMRELTDSELDLVTGGDAPNEMITVPLEVAKAGIAVATFVTGFVLGLVGVTPK